MTRLYRKLASTAEWVDRIKARPDGVDKSMIDTAEDQLEQLINLLPHGSGIDGKTSISVKPYDLAIIDMTNDIELHKRIKVLEKTQVLEISSEYHYMDENGFYAGWFGFTLILTPSLEYGFKIDFRIDWNDTELSESEIDDLFGDYLCETFQWALNKQVTNFGSGIYSFLE